ncbi:hypothetical protein H9P43_006049 [Blastocladiella emersonii ATCC 22665]|nr:hypothetical protein H9P43_006049 [Blastocladiella emersonii ATCC 22665]
MNRARPILSPLPRGQQSARAAMPVSAFEKSVFSVAYIATRDNELSPGLTWALTVIEDLQLLSFVYNPHLHKGLPWLIGAILEPTRMLQDYASFSAANTFGVVLVFIAVILVAAVSTLTHHQLRVPIWSLRFLRILFTLLMTALSVPVATVFVLGVHCSKGMLPEFGMACTGPHLPLLVLDAIGLITFFPLMLVSALILIDVSPTSHSPHAKAHGRVDVRIAALRMLLVFLDVFMHDLGPAGTGKWVFMAVTALGTGAIALQLVQTQPYYDERMNMLRSAMATAACLSMVTSMVLYGLHAPSIGWVALIPSTAIGLAAGAWLSRWSARRYLARTIHHWHQVQRAEADTWTDADVLEVRALTLGRGSAGRRLSIGTRMASSDGARMASTDDAPPSMPFVSMIHSPSDEPNMFFGLDDGGAGARRRQQSLRATLQRAARLTPIASMANTTATIEPIDGFPPAAPRRQHASVVSNMRLNDSENRAIGTVIAGTSLDALNVIKEQPPKRRTQVFDSPLQVELCLRLIRDEPTPSQIAAGLSLLERGLMEFPDDPLLVLLAAMYLSSYYGEIGEHSAAELMFDLHTTARSGGIPIDVRFLVYVRERVARDRGAHVLDQTLLESLEREARAHHLQALSSVRTMWEAVRTSAPVAQLCDAIEQLAIHQSGAAKCYRKILDRSPRNKNVLRAYAQFLQCVEADPNKAAQVLELAEEVELMETQRRSNGATLPVLDQGCLRSALSLNSGSMIDSNDALASTNSLPAKTQDNSLPAKTQGDSQPAESASESPDRLDLVTSRPLAPARSRELNREERESESPWHPQQQQQPERKYQGAGETQNQVNFSNGIKRSTMSPLTPASAMSYGGGAMAARATSDTSGNSRTSTSKVQRQKIQMRALLVKRISAPARRNWQLTVLGGVYLACLAIGFFACVSFFSQTSDLINNQFENARIARTSAVSVVQSMRSLVAVPGAIAIPGGGGGWGGGGGNGTGSGTGAGTGSGTNNSAARSYNRTLDTLRNTTTLVMNTVLPALSTQASSSDQVVPRFRAYRVHAQADNSSTNYIPEDLSPLDALVAVVQAASLALAYTVPSSLTVARFMSIVELRFIVENLTPIFNALRALPQSGLDRYLDLVKSNFAFMVATAVGTLVFLVLTVAYVYHSVFRAFLSYERRALSLLRGIPKRIASAMVTQIEEELESFRGVTETDDAHEADVDRAALDTLSDQHGRFTSGANRMRFLALVHAIVALAIGGTVFAMFAVAMQSTYLEADMVRMVQSNDRMFFSGVLRTYMREYYSQDKTISLVSVVRSSRGALLDLVKTHTALVSDENGLNAMLPSLTVHPRNCTVARVCGNDDKPQFGFPAASASTPLNAQISRLAATTDYFLGAITVNTTANITVTSGTAYQTYQLATILQQDVAARLTTLDAAIQDLLNARIAQAQALCIITFVASVLLSGTAVFGLWAIGLRRLRREARTLAAVLHLVPPDTLRECPHDTVEVESLGASLPLADADEVLATGFPLSEDWSELLAKVNDQPDLLLGTHIVKSCTRLPFPPEALDVKGDWVLSELPVLAELTLHLEPLFVFNRGHLGH